VTRDGWAEGGRGLDDGQGAGMDTLVPVIGLSRSTFLADSAGGVCQYVEEGGRKGIQPVRGMQSWDPVPRGGEGVDCLISTRRVAHMRTRR